ncbi:MAG: DUF4347 domain-containing protein [Roseiarcus sp.]
MSNSDADPAGPQQVVFIDSNVPDLQALIAGAHRGELVYVLDPERDGVGQIAEFLDADGLSELSAIAIVGHGAPGAIDLGATRLGEAELAPRAAPLARIGAALAPGGAIALYACATAAGAAGRRFIDALCAHAGGVGVAAATHPVGAPAGGGSWTLDASAGGAPAPARAPFTADTLARYQGALTSNGRIWFGTFNDVEVVPFGSVGSDGSGESTFSSSGAAGFYNQDVAVDLSSGLYFAINEDGADGNDSVTLEVGNSTTGALLQSLSLNPGGASSDYVINALAVDPVHHFIYVGVWGDGTADSGIIKLSYNPSTGVLNSGNSIFSGGVIAPSYYVVSNSTGSSFTNPGSLYLDVPDNKLYFTANDLQEGSAYGFGYPDTNGVYVVNLSSGSPVATLLSSQAQFPVSNPDAAISALAVNQAQGIIYFATTAYSSLTAQSTLWEMPIGGGTATQMSLPSGISLGFVEPAGLTFDPVSRQLIVSDGGNSNDAILPHAYTFTLNANGTGLTSGSVLVTAPAGDTTSVTFDTTPTPGTESASSPGGADIDAGRTVTFSIATNEPVVVTEGGAAPTLALDDFRVATYSGAVGAYVSALTFSYTVLPGDNVADLQATAFNGLANGTTILDANGNSINLTGFSTINTDVKVDTVAPAVVSIGAFGSNPNNFSAEQFTVTFSEIVSGVTTGSFALTDTGSVGGAIASVSGSGSSYTVTVNGVSGNGTMRLDLKSLGSGVVDLAGNAISGGYTGGQTYTIQDSAPTLGAESSSSPGGTDIGVGQTVTFTIATSGAVTVTNGGNGLPTLALNDGRTATYSGAVGSALNSLTFSYTVQAGDTAADLEATAFNALPAGTTIKDGAGNSLDASGFSTVDAGVQVDTTPPALSNLAASITYAVQGPAQTLSPNLLLTVEADDATLSGATVTIAGGFVGDGDVLAAITTGLPSITAVWNSATETLTLSGTDTRADYQAVLDSVTFESTAIDPTSSGASLSRTVSWQATGIPNGGSLVQTETVKLVEVVSSGISTSGVTLYPGGRQTVFMGGMASGTTVISGSSQVVAAGGMTNGDVVSSGGGQYLDSGGAASGTTLSGGNQYVEIGGSASGTTVLGGTQVVYGAASGTLVEGGGRVDVESGATVSGTIVSSGAVVVLGSAGGTVVHSGGADYVDSGGSAGGTQVSGGDEYVEAGGAASGTTVSGGAQVVYGAASGTVLASGGYQYVEAGGAAIGTNIGSGGVESLYGGASGTIVDSGGADYVNSGGLAMSTTVSGGEEFVERFGESTGATVDGGAQVVYGFALDTTLNSGGYQYVEAAGEAGNTIVNATGVLSVYGLAIGALVQSGGADYVEAGGATSDGRISGGDEFVEAGGSAAYSLVSGGAEVVYGTATSAGLVAGGYQYVEAGGVASGTTVASGGYEYVLSGGAVSGATISGGEIELTSGAIDGAAAVTFAASAGGTLRLDDSVHFGGLVAGFAQPDQLDLSDIGFGPNTHLSFVEAGGNLSGTLTVTDGVHAANLTLLGQYVTAQFTSASDGHGGTLIGDPPLGAATDRAPPTLLAPTV